MLVQRSDWLRGLGACGLEAGVAAGDGRKHSMANNRNTKYSRPWHVSFTNFVYILCNTKLIGRYLG